MRRIRWTVGVKLAAGLLPLFTVLSLTGWLSYNTAAQLQARYERLQTDTYPSVMAALKLQGEIHAISQHIMAFAATKESSQATAIAEARTRAQQHLETLTDSGSNNEQLAASIAEVHSQLDKFTQMSDQVLKDGSDLEYSQLIYQAELSRALGEKATRTLETVVEHLQGEVDAARLAARQATASASTVMAMAIGFGSITAILISVLMGLSIVRPLRTLAAQLGRIAKGTGDLTQKTNITSRDEVGQLGQNFNEMLTGLAGMVRQVINTASEYQVRAREMAETSTLSVTSIQAVSTAMDQVAGGAHNQVQSTTTAKRAMEELVNAVEQLANGAQIQTQHVHNTNFMVGQMVVETDAVAAQGAEVARASAEAAETARRGASVLQQSLASLSQIQTKVQDASSKVEDLGKQSARIAEVLRVIRGIAEQTNMLALNAAIEAARAGVHGRGFAVVAEEVRKLAAEASTATREIGELTHSIQAGTIKAMEAMEDTKTDVKVGTALAATAEQSLAEILTVVTRTTGNVTSISDAAARLLHSCQEVSKCFAEVAAVTEENSAATEEMAAGAAQVLSSIADINAVAERNGQAVAEVAASMGYASEAMDQIKRSASELAQVSEQLQSLVGQFTV